MEAKGTRVGGEPGASPPLERAGCLLLAVAALALLAPGLGTVGFSAPDEPRTAAVTREMFTMEHGPAGLVLLHLNGEAYTQKPPLYYWLASAVSLVPGKVTEWSARLPSLLAGFATLLLTFALGRRLLGSRSALLGVALLLTTYKFAHLARRVQFDVVLTAFELGALLAFWRLDRGIGSGARNRIALHACLGLALLTKGPVGFLIPVLVAASHLAVERRLPDLRRAFSRPALFLSLGPILAWLAAAVALAPAGFLGDAVGGGVLARFFEGTSHARPIYYFFYQLPIECLPWTLLWPAAVWAARRRVFVAGSEEGRRRAWRFLLVWVGASFAFFSLSAGKRGLYLLPSVPAVALLCADALELALRGRARPPRALSLGAAAAALALLAAAIELGRMDEISGIAVPTSFLAVLAAAPVVAGLAWIATVRAGRAGGALWVAIACVGVIEAAAFQSLEPAFDPIRSMKPVAAAALRWTHPGQPLALLGSRSMVGGLAYYAERPVTWIDDPADVPTHFERGGGALVLKQSKLARLREHAEVTVLERLREGDRAIVIVRPAAPGGRASPP